MSSFDPDQLESEQSYVQKAREEEQQQGLIGQQNDGPLSGDDALPMLMGITLTEPTPMTNSNTKQKNTNLARLGGGGSTRPVDPSVATGPSMGKLGSSNNRRNSNSKSPKVTPKQSPLQPSLHDDNGVLADLMWATGGLPGGGYTVTTGADGGGPPTVAAARRNSANASRAVDLGAAMRSHVLKGNHPINTSREYSSDERGGGGARGSQSLQRKLSRLTQRSSHASSGGGGMNTLLRSNSIRGVGGGGGGRRATNGVGGESAAAAGDLDNSFANMGVGRQPSTRMLSTLRGLGGGSATELLRRGSMARSVVSSSAARGNRIAVRRGVGDAVDNSDDDDDSSDSSEEEGGALAAKKRKLIAMKEKARRAAQKRALAAKARRGVSNNSNNLMGDNSTQFLGATLQAPSHISGTYSQRVSVGGLGAGGGGGGGDDARASQVYSALGAGGSQLHSSQIASNRSGGGYSDLEGELSKHEMDEITAFEREIAEEEAFEARRNQVSYCARFLIPPRKVKDSSLFIFSAENRLRAFIYNVCHHKVFEIFIILNIIANTIVMAFTDPKAESNRPYEDALDIYFTVIFTVEMILKIVSLGFVLHKGSYLRSPWNVLDFLIVCLAYINYIPGMANLTALRSIRVLRPLRSMNAIGGIRFIVLGLIRSVAGLVHVMSLLGIIFIIFGIGGVQLWMGTFRYRCVPYAQLPGGANETADMLEWEIGSFCKPGNEPGVGAFGYGCPEDHACFAVGNGDANILNFDSFPQACMLLFVIMTFEGWPGYLTTTYDVWGQFAFIYFFVFILFASYFVPNLALAVINEKFVEVHNKVLQEEEMAMLEAEQKAVDDVVAKAAEAAKTTNHNTPAVQSAEVEMTTEFVKGAPPPPPPASGDVGGAVNVVDADGNEAAAIRDDESVVINEGEEALDTFVFGGGEDEARRNAEAEALIHAQRTCGEKFKFYLEAVRDFLFLHIEGYTKPKHLSALPCFGGAGAVPPTAEEEAAAADAESNSSITIYTVVMMLFIILNSVLLASQHYGQPDWLTDLQNVGNRVFTAVFAVDCVIRLFAMGIRLYFKELMNWVDIGTSIASVIELFIGGSSVAVVFRSFRLFRIFKLFRNFKSLHKILRILATSMRDTGFLSVIVVLYIYMAALIGMQLFGVQWEEGGRDVTEERSGFTTFFRSVVTVFQMMTFDGWNDIVVHAVAVTSPAAVLYFIICVLIGNYLIIQLFLAILIGAFEEDDILELVDAEEERQRALLLAEQTAGGDHFFRTRSFKALHLRSGMAMVGNRQQVQSLLFDAETAALIRKGAGTALSVGGRGDRSAQMSRRNSLVVREKATGSTVPNHNQRTSHTGIDGIIGGGGREAGVPLAVYDPSAPFGVPVVDPMNPTAAATAMKALPPNIESEAAAMTRGNAISYLRNLMSHKNRGGVGVGGASVNAAGDLSASEGITRGGGITRMHMLYYLTAPMARNLHRMRLLHQRRERLEQFVEQSRAVSPHDALATLAVTQQLGSGGGGGDGLANLTANRGGLSPRPQQLTPHRSTSPFLIPQLRIQAESRTSHHSSHHNPSPSALQLVPSGNSPKPPPPLDNAMSNRNQPQPDGNSNDLTSDNTWAHFLKEGTINNAGEGAQQSTSSSAALAIPSLAVPELAFSPKSSSSTDLDAPGHSADAARQKGGTASAAISQQLGGDGIFLPSPRSSFLDGTLSGLNTGRVDTLGAKKDSLFQNPLIVSDDEEDEPEIVCEVCGLTILPSLPSAPLVPRRHAKDVHRRMCDVMSQRDNNLKLLDTLSEFIASQEAAGELPSLMFLEYLLSQAWSMGLLVATQAEDLLGDNWDKCNEVIAEERQAINLCVGEERVGRGFLSFVVGAVHIPITETNGGVSLFIFGPENPFRIKLTELVQHPWFDRFILVCILISSLLLAIETPRDKNATVTEVLLIADYVFTTIFCFEMVCKILALGFVFHESAYLRDLWNWLDAVIVVVSLISLSVTSVNVGFLKVLRVFRALRPLRLITRNRGLQSVVLTLFKSAKGILNVVIVALLNYTIFSILGVQLFSGAFYRCSDETLTAKSECRGTFINAMGAQRERVWFSSPRNFDNFGNAMLTLFEVSTMEWWTDVLWDSVDSVGKDTAPVKDNNVAYALFYLVFIVIASFVLLNMFVGVMISSFNTVKAQLEGISLLTDDQRMWGEAQRILLNFEPTPYIYAGRFKISAFMFKIVANTTFEFFIFGCVVANIIVLACDHYEPPAAMSSALSIINDIFSAIFIIEVIAKVVAMELRFFLDPYSRMDFVLILISIVNFSIRGVADININVLQVLRVFRILRIFRIVKRAKKIRILMEALWSSLPSIANVGGLMLLLMFLYSVLGVQLFYNIDNGSIIDGKYTNFFNFWNAFQLLVRFVTMTDWNQTMHDCMVRPPLCDDSNPEVSDCGNAAAPLYFISFIILASFVLVNLIVAIILDNFNTTTHIEKSQVQMHDILRFIEVWSTLDKDATMLIHADKFPFLLAKLRPPLGIPHQKNRFEMLKQCRQYEIPIHDGTIHFYETLIPLARTTLAVVMPRRQLREQERAWREATPLVASLPLHRVMHGSRIATVDMYFAAVLIQSAHRRRMCMREADRRRQEKKDAIKKHNKDNGVGEGRQVALLAEANKSVVGPNQPFFESEHSTAQPSNPKTETAPAAVRTFSTDSHTSPLNKVAIRRTNTGGGTSSVHKNSTSLHTDGSTLNTIPIENDLTVQRLSLTTEGMSPRSNVSHCEAAAHLLNFEANHNTSVTSVPVVPPPLPPLPHPTPTANSAGVALAAPPLSFVARPTHPSAADDATGPVTAQNPLMPLSSVSSARDSFSAMAPPAIGVNGRGGVENGGA